MSGGGVWVSGRERAARVAGTPQLTTFTAVISGMHALSHTAARPSTVSRRCQNCPSSERMTSGPSRSTNSMAPVMPIDSGFSWQPNMLAVVGKGAAWRRRGARWRWAVEEAVVVEMKAMAVVAEMEVEAVAEVVALQLVVVRGSCTSPRTPR